MKSNKIEERRTKIKTWLLQTGMTRPQLAARLGVTLASVNNWLSCTNIPERRWNDILSVFNEETEPVRNRIVGTSLTDEEMAFVEEAATKHGMSTEDFLRNCILQLLDGE